MRNARVAALRFPPAGTIHTVLFDLDGTLADTAPDLAFALNCVLEEEGAEPLDFQLIRPLISFGGKAMVERAFGIGPEARHFARLYARFLHIYSENVATHTRLFPGMAAVLDRIEACTMRWGVVTNKTGRLTTPLMAALGLAERAACIVSGDTTQNRKPHPEPLLLACRQTHTSPQQCLYVGDAAKDIEAGREAGIHTMVALFGYIPPEEDPRAWGADYFISAPQDLLDWLALEGSPP